MEVNAKEYTVADLVQQRILAKPLDGNHGSIHPKSSDFVSTGIPFVMASDLTEGRVDFKNCKFISPEQAKKLRKGFSEEEDILISHKATIGRTAIVQKNPYKYILLTPQVTYYRVLDKSRLNPRYLKYYFDSRDFQNILQSWAGSGSTRAYIGITAQQKLPIYLPSIETQTQIARILGTLDDKIELNQQMNRTLEATARAIFKSWFVDFDPVRAKIDGRQPEGMDAQTAAIFPAAFEDSELGMIPQGWRVSTIGKLVKVVGGSTPSTKNPAYWDGGTIPWATPKVLASLQNSVLLDTERKITELGLQKISSGLLPKGTLLLSSRAPIGYLAISEISVAVNQGFIAMICDRELSNHYVLHWTRENMDVIKGRANGTTFLEISKSNFRPIEIIIPDKQILAKFTIQAESLHQKIINNIRQSNALATLRDTLLPKLMSGEIRVVEAEKMVENVT